MQNIEFKAELRDRSAAQRQCRLVGATHLGVLQQTDTYYRMPDGRLKRREAPGEPTEWIYYHRPDRVRPCMCNYTILSEQQARTRWGIDNLRPWLVVRKTRDLWMLDRVRIHLDEVEQLGRFIEFEAILSREFTVRQAHAVVARLREAFAPILGEPIAVSYSDLMESAESRRR